MSRQGEVSQRSRVLYWHLIQSGKHVPAKVALGLNVSASTLYKWCEGVNEMPAKYDGPLLSVTGDIDLFCDLHGLGERGFVLSRVPEAAAPKDIERQTLEVNAAAGRLTQRVIASLGNDGRIDANEAKDIAHDVEDMQREGEELQNLVQLRKGAVA